MVYDFNCTKCGKELTQDTVLYEFLDNLYKFMFETNDQVVEKKKDNYTEVAVEGFRRLRVRLLQKDLRTLLGDQWDTAKRTYCRCELRLETLLGFIGETHNLGVKGLEALRFEEIQLFADGKDDELPENVRSLLKQVCDAKMYDARSESETETWNSLRQEAKMLCDLFFGGVCTFGIRLETDRYNDEVITGFTFCPVEGDLLNESMAYECKNARLCNVKSCESKLFMRAGAAKQIKIGFIGRQGSGKTSAILALAGMLLGHTSQNYAPADQEQLRRCMQGMVTPENISNDEIVVNELINYGKGIAPSKTKAKGRQLTDGSEKQVSDAYAITLQLAPDLLLTLTDIPGEAFNERTGMVDASVLGSFQSVLRVDAFVFCYDASREAPKAVRYGWLGESRTLPDDLKGDILELHRLLTHTDTQETGGGIPLQEKSRNWIRDIQSYWSRENKTDGKQIPVLILYMKDPSVEQAANIRNVKEQSKNLVCGGIFPEEQIALNTPELGSRYQTFRDNFKRENPGFYYTELRCSPYGFAAVNEDVLNKAREKMTRKENIRDQVREKKNQVARKNGEKMAACQQMEADRSRLEQLLTQESPAWRAYLEEPREALEAAYREADQALRQKKEELEDKTGERTRQQNELERMRRQLTECENCRKSLEALAPRVKEIQERRQRLTALGNEVEAAETELDDLKKETPQMIINIDADRLRTEDAVDSDLDKKYQEQIQSLEAEVDGQKQKLDALRQEYKKLEDQLISTRDRDNRLLVQAQELRETADDYEKIKFGINDQKERVKMAETAEAAALSQYGEAETACRKAREQLDKQNQYGNMTPNQLKQCLEDRRRQLESQLREAKKLDQDAARAEAILTQIEEEAQKQYEAAHEEFEEYENVLLFGKDPEPKNVGHLARWVLHVSGCIPVKELADIDREEIDDYTCDPPEFRTGLAERKGDKPAGESRNGLAEIRQWMHAWGNRIYARVDADEYARYRSAAAAHCYLFDNPTHQDTEMRDCKNRFNAYTVLSYEL